MGLSRRWAVHGRWSFAPRGTSWAPAGFCLQWSLSITHCWACPSLQHRQTATGHGVTSLSSPHLDSSTSWCSLTFVFGSGLDDLLISSGCQRRINTSPETPHLFSSLPEHPGVKVCGWPEPLVEAGQRGWEVEASWRSPRSRSTGGQVACTLGRRCRATAAGATSGWWSIGRCTTLLSGPKGTREGSGSSATTPERMPRWPFTEIVKLIWQTLKKNVFVYPPNFCFFQEAFTAFHPDLKWVQKFLKPLLIGELAATEPSQDRNKSVRSVSDSSSKNKHLISCVSRQRWDHVQRLRTTQTAYMPCFSCLFASPALKLYTCTSSNVARTSPFSLGPPLTGVCSSPLSGDHHTGFPHFTRQGGERGSVPSSALVLLLPPGSHPAAGGPGLADHLGLGNQLDAHPSQRLPAGNLSGDPEHSFAARRYCQQTLS